MIAYDVGLGTGAIGGLLSVFAILRLLAGAAALVLGLVAASRRGLPQLASGIAVGVGGYTVVSTVIGLLTGPIFSLLY